MAHLPTVAALSVVENDKVLLVQRRLSANRTHPDMVSVPTMRIPRSLAEELVRLCGEPSVGNLDTSGHDPRVFVVEAIISRKLDVVLEAAEMPEAMSFRVRVAAVVEGTAQYGAGEVGSDPSSEDLTMINLLVELHLPCRGQLSRLLPLSSSSYSRRIWVPIHDFLSVDHDPWWRARLGGVCVESTRQALTR